MMDCIPAGIHRWNSFGLQMLNVPHMESMMSRTGLLMFSWRQTKTHTCWHSHSKFHSGHITPQSPSLALSSILAPLHFTSFSFIPFPSLSSWSLPLTPPPHTPVHTMTCSNIEEFSCYFKELPSLESSVSKRNHKYHTRQSRIDEVYVHMPTLYVHLCTEVSMETRSGCGS